MSDNELKEAMRKEAIGGGPVKTVDGERVPTMREYEEARKVADRDDETDVDAIEQRLDHDQSKPDDCQCIPRGFASDFYELIDRAHELEEENARLRRMAGIGSDGLADPEDMLRDLEPNEKAEELLRKAFYPERDDRSFEISALRDFFYESDVDIESYLGVSTLRVENWMSLRFHPNDEQKAKLKALLDRYEEVNGE